MSAPSFPNLPLRRLDLVVALTVVFGLESLRAWMPQLGFLLRDRVGWRSEEIGGAALLLPVAVALCLWAGSALAPWRLVRVAVGALTLLRVLTQVWQGDPLVDLGLVSAAVLAFCVAVAALGRLAASLGGSAALDRGWVLGLLADLALHAAAGTWDLIWRPDAWALVAVLSLAALAIWALAGKPTPSAAYPAASVWIGLFPLLLLHMLLLGNPARFALGSGLPLDGPSIPLAATWLGAWLWAGWVLGSVVRAWVSADGRRSSPAPAALAGAGLLFFTWWAWPDGVEAWPLWAVGCAAEGFLVQRLLSRPGLERVEPSDTASSRGSRSTWIFGATGGVLVFFVVSFFHSSAWDIPWPPVTGRPEAMAAVIVCACVWLRRPRRGGAGDGGAGEASSEPPLLVSLRGVSLRGVSLLAVSFLAVPWAAWWIGSAGSDSVDRPADAARPLRIVTYNLHSGVDPTGHLDLESMAATIEAEEPDVVLLQEVSRGWLVNGSVDIASWLVHRLELPMVFAGTADQSWGNAVLTRLPVRAMRRHDLPPADLLLRRGVLDVALELPDGEPLRILATHYHHPRSGGAERVEQSAAVLSIWGGSPRTVFGGDLNALPRHPEIEALRAAGLGDVLDLAGVVPGHTYPSHDPVRRIDYLWVTGDLAIEDAWVSSSTASDHAAVSATITAAAPR